MGEVSIAMKDKKLGTFIMITKTGKMIKVIVVRKRDRIELYIRGSLLSDVRK